MTDLEKYHKLCQINRTAHQLNAEGKSLIDIALELAAQLERIQQDQMQEISYAELKDLSINMHAEITHQQEWKYSHDEIARTEGAERALKIRQRIMERRARINADREN